MKLVKDEVKEMEAVKEGGQDRGEEAGGGGGGSGCSSGDSAKPTAADPLSPSTPAAGQQRANTNSGAVLLTRGDFEAALPKVQPSAMREVAVEVPNVRWSDIGGQAEVKQSIKEAVEWPLQHPGAFLRMGISPPKGNNIYGWYCCLSL